MKISKSVLLFIMFSLLGGIVSIGNVSAQTQSPTKEEIVLTTYYPVPYGDYQSLRLWPSTQKSCDENKRGTLYYDDTANKVMVCTLSADNMTYVWQALGQELWTRKDNNISPNDLSWNVGIGTISPTNPAPNTQQGNLDVNDVYLRSLDKWISQETVKTGTLCGMATYNIYNGWSWMWPCEDKYPYDGCPPHYIARIVHVNGGVDTIYSCVRY